jgi:hypothetical protein
MNSLKFRDFINPSLSRTCTTTLYNVQYTYSKLFNFYCQVKIVRKYESTKVVVLSYVYLRSTCTTRTCNNSKRLVKVYVYCCTKVQYVHIKSCTFEDRILYVYGIISCTKVVYNTK